MEHIIHLLIGFIVLSFLLKTGFYPRWGIWLSALVYTVFLICIGPWATEQSPTEINSLLASAPHILTLSVYVTLEASIMIAFCFNCFADTSKQRTLFQRTVCGGVWHDKGILYRNMDFYDGAGSRIVKAINWIA